MTQGKLSFCFRFFLPDLHLNSATLSSAAGVGEAGSSGARDLLLWTMTGTAVATFRGHSGCRVPVAAATTTGAARDTLGLAREAKRRGRDREDGDRG